MDILLASRVGDLDRVRYLVEERGHDVNSKYKTILCDLKPPRTLPDMRLLYVT
jgi:hypothetical protein